MMRKVMSVCMMAMMISTGAGADATTSSEEEVINLLRDPHYLQQAGAIEAAVENGTTDSLAAAIKEYLDRIFGTPAGSLCVRGVPSKPVGDIRLPTVNSIPNRPVELPAGPSARGGGDGVDALWFRILEVELDLGNCSASGIAYVAFTDSAVAVSDLWSWKEWLRQ